jgi:hypothetical protein
MSKYALHEIADAGDFLGPRPNGDIYTEVNGRS